MKSLAEKIFTGKARGKNSRAARVLALTVLLSLLLSACAGTENITEVTEKGSDDLISIGMSFDSFVIERWQRDKDVFASTAKELGAEVNVQNANGDVEKQKEQIDYLIKKGMDVIVIVCIDSDSLSEQVKAAHDAGIKVIAYDRLINNSNVDLYITFDNDQVGRLMGEELVNAGIAGKNVIMIGGSPTDSNVEHVDGGFRAVMERNDVRLLDVVHADGWRAEFAAEYIYENPELVAQADAIMCGNDNLAGQAIHALAEVRLAGEILVTGQDAELEACQRIVEGTQLMTVYKPVEKLAKRAAECAVALACGEKLEGDDVSTLDDGTYTVPYIGMEPIAVTSENMEEVIVGSGFHLYDDVYRYEHLASAD